MKYFLIFPALIAVFNLGAQTNTGNSNVPNSGANTSPPPMQTFTTPGDNLANPSNSTVPGANGSYSIDPGKPDFQNPGTNGSYTTYPSSPQPTTTYSPQTKTTAGQKKKSRK